MAAAVTNMFVPNMLSTNGAIVAGICAGALALWPTSAAGPVSARGNPSSPIVRLAQSATRYCCRHSWWRYAAGIVIATALSLVAPLAAIVATSIIGAAGVRLNRSVRRAASQRATRNALATSLSGIIRELDAGAPAEEALRRIVATGKAQRGHIKRGPAPRPVLGSGRRAARSHRAAAHVADLLVVLPHNTGRSAVGLPHRTGGHAGNAVLDDWWQRLHSAWQLAAQTGIPLAPLLRSLAGELAADAEAEQERAAEVAGPAMSGYLLAALPAEGIALGVGIGTNPLAVLFGSTIGGMLLVGGAALSAAGLVWTNAIVRR